MKKLFVMMVVVLACGVVFADIFDAGGANEFTIEFVDISGNANSANGTNISSHSPGHFRYRTFTDPGDFRIGTYEITNDQWYKFRASYGTVTGSPSTAYDHSPSFTGTNVPTNRLSWYEAAQFVNYLNASTGHQAAYKFTGTQGTGDYTFVPWQSDDVGYDLTNPYRNSEAFYFMPTEDEFIKAAYWNGTSLQTYATKAGESLTQGDGTSGTGWNYDDGGYATDPLGPWDVGSGSEELNGTFDMMGNVWECIESPYESYDYNSGSWRALRGGSYLRTGSRLSSSYRDSYNSPFSEDNHVGFRVASNVPEPCSLVLLGLGSLILHRRKR